MMWYSSSSNAIWVLPLRYELWWLTLCFSRLHVVVKKYISLCTGLGQELETGEAAMPSTTCSMDHDHHEAQASASMPGSQHDPILAVQPPRTHRHFQLMVPSLFIGHL